MVSHQTDSIFYLLVLEKVGTVDALENNRMLVFAQVDQQLLVVSGRDDIWDVADKWIFVFTAFIVVNFFADSVQ